MRQTVLINVLICNQENKNGDEMDRSQQLFKKMDRDIFIMMLKQKIFLPSKQEQETSHEWCM